MGQTGSIIAVSSSASHSFSKTVRASITLIAGHGVDGDAHAGATTQHRYLKKKNPSQSNLTQVHLIHEELFAQLADRGFDVGPGDLGENITTRGIDLLALPLGTRLRFGDAVVEVTGLRSPCTLINRFRAGLMKELVGKDDGGHVIRKSGIMAIVVSGGVLRAGDTIVVELPAGDHLPLGVV
jgi:MOSC domain-containing protein YiiM